MSNSQDTITSIQQRLNTKFVGQHIHYYQKLTSTMEEAKKLAQEGASEGTVIITDEQTSGRGRLARIWLSPVGNLAMSIILRPSPDILQQLVMVASLAVVRAITKVVGLPVRIKWPNDILLKGKKVCGILIESEVQGNNVNTAIIGIGININLDPSAFPEISAIATSLSHESGKEVSKAELTGALLYELEHLYIKAQAGVLLYKEWQENMETIGKWARVSTGKSVEQGKAERVTENGSLVLRRSDGSLAEIVAGDVTVIKD